MGLKDNDLWKKYFIAYIKELENRGINDFNLEDTFHSGWLCAIDAFNHELEKQFLLPDDVIQWDPEAGTQLDSTSSIPKVPEGTDFIIKVTKPK